MADRKNYITLSRDIRNNCLWNDKPFNRACAWIDILLSAYWCDKTVIIKGQVIKVKRGQSITSIKTFSEKWGWSQSKVTRFLKYLKNEDQIEYQNIGVTTLITIKISCPGPKSF